MVALGLSNNQTVNNRHSYRTDERRNIAVYAMVSPSMDKTCPWVNVVLADSHEKSHKWREF